MFAGYWRNTVFNKRLLGRPSGSLAISLLTSAPWALDLVVPHGRPRRALISWPSAPGCVRRPPLGLRWTPVWKAPCGKIALAWPLACELIAFLLLIRIRRSPVPSCPPRNEASRARACVWFSFEGFFSNSFRRARSYADFPDAVFASHEPSIWETPFVFDRA